MCIDTAVSSTGQSLQIVWRLYVHVCGHCAVHIMISVELPLSYNIACTCALQT